MASVVVLDGATQAAKLLREGGHRVFERERGVEAGADAFIAQPFDQQQLRLRISELIATRKSGNPPSRETEMTEQEGIHEPHDSRGRR